MNNKLLGKESTNGNGNGKLDGRTRINQTDHNRTIKTVPKGTTTIYSRPITESNMMGRPRTKKIF